MKISTTIHTQIAACRAITFGTLVCGALVCGALAGGALASLPAAANASEFTHNATGNIAGNAGNDSANASLVIAETGSDKAAALQHMQPRKADSTPAHAGKHRLSGKDWETQLKPYIDAHRERWMRS